jgi:hypothetical protein
MARALKVFRLPIGFHDAYVAAPSQKAAAEAWGSDTSVFSRGEAELVTDPVLTAEPLANPGKVIKRLRGSAAEQIAALGPDEPAEAERSKRPSAAKPKNKPKPSRAPLEEAEQALEEADLPPFFSSFLITRLVEPDVHLGAAVLGAGIAELGRRAPCGWRGWNRGRAASSDRRWKSAS